MSLVQPLIITGQMRSGTTFLSNFLNSQKGIVIYADFLRSLLGVNLDNKKLIKFNDELNNTRKNVIISSLIAEGRLNGIDLEIFINRNKISTWLDLYKNVLNAIWEIEGTHNRIIGVKRTGYIAFKEDLLRSGTKIIYIYRDPRDVLYSSKNRFGGYSEYKFLEEYTESVSAFINLKCNNIFFLKFEDFILEKEKISKQLSEFLNVEINSSLEVIKDKKNLNFTSNSAFGDVNKLFDSNAVHRYKSIPLEETARIEVICNSLIKRLEYDIREIDKKYAKKVKNDFKKYLWKRKIRNKLRRLYSKLFDE